MDPGYSRNTDLGLCRRRVKAQCGQSITENARGSPGGCREAAATPALP